MKKTAIVFLFIALVSSLSFSFEKAKLGSLGDTYELRIPSNYSDSEFYSLIVGLHGATSNPADFVKILQDFVDTYQFILYCPKSIGSSWRVDNDIGTIFKGIEEIKAKYHISAKRIYISGFSAGTYMAYYLGLLNPSVFSGIIALSGTLNPDILSYSSEIKHIKKSMKIKVAIVHGAVDKVNSVINGRSAYSLLKNSGFDVMYKEIKDLKHDYPPKDIINELLVFITKQEKKQDKKPDKK